MVLEKNDLLPMAIWLPWALLYWVLVAFSVGLAALAFCWVVAALRYGPRAASVMVGQVLAAGVRDWLLLSPRRVLALARLAIQESLRRRVIVVFAVFVTILLFAGWFLDPGSNNPGRLYLSFVLSTTGFLVVLLSLFLSALSLPADFKNKTLHTVVTKPVRPSEIFLGRVLGFVAVGTVLLAIMAAVSYVFVVRGLAHTHQVAEADLQPLDASASADQPGARRGRTNRVNQHRHDVYVDAQGNARLEMAQGHWHEITVDRSGGKTAYRIGPPQGMLLARVPVYGKIHFKQRDGKDAEKGVSVGDEWTYRSYVEGGTLAAIIWSFGDVTPERFPDGLPLELTIEVFRTFKGDVEKGIPGSLSVRNPETGLSVEAKIFPAKEFETDMQFIPRELQTPEGRKVDLFKDLVTKDGRTEIWLRCLQNQQFFGAAQADMYLHARNASFVGNFLKGYVGIWLQMVLVTVIGVMFSTFLSAPIAMLATAGALVGGFFQQYMLELATGTVIGGGPVEAFIRIINQDNLTSEMEPGVRTVLVQTTDRVLEGFLWVITAMLPDFSRFDFSDYVAYGFDISQGLFLQCALKTLAYVLPMAVAGYFFLKTREVAR